MHWGKIIIGTGNSVRKKRESVIQENSIPTDWEEALIYCDTCKRKFRANFQKCLEYNVPWVSTCGLADTAGRL